MIRGPLLFAVFGLASFVGESPDQEQSTHQNGTILETASGFQFATYEEWIETRGKQFTFNEAEFRKEYPPERFSEYKAELGVPFGTYDEWIQVLKMRFRASEFSEKTFREKYPPEEFQRYKEGIDVQAIRYMSDSLAIPGYLLRPRRSEAETLPVIIYNRGGNREVGRIEFETLYSLFDMVLHGYIVVASQYRGCCGGKGRDEFGGADLNDVLNLFPLIDSLPFADASRIGMFGWSRGGMMTYSELIPGYESDKEGTLRPRSALYWPDKLHKDTPLLLLQGSADRRNDPLDVLRMAQRLYENDHPFRLVFYEDGDHGLTQYESDVRKSILDWFDLYVRDSGSPPGRNSGPGSS
jgi:acetyl esterase/lipase